ncbi:arsenic resistance protein [Gulosibacter sp. 10]|uniref:arsenic resistance protein n=1 Tax=Gulosibacter sp. 10 TaxID=1255570 RepID=UPI00097F31B3|nr:arsenic resistance protein [Gulosibacter sp. 10]SJM71037.1 Arsenical-resistance protein ACR3 [Gulosibacter sp. 10]
MRAAVRWMERHQVALYLLALLVGGLAGALLPGLAAPAGFAVTPVLGLLLYATFLGVPFAEIRGAFRDRRFLGAVLLVNFAAAPLVVWPLSRIVAHEQALLVGVLFVLLTPCVDYVIVFTGLAGGASALLLAAAPLLMLAQMLLLPVYLWLFLGPGFVAAVDLAPFAEAFAALILLPLLAAWLTQLAARRSRAGRALRSAGLGAMVPLMMLTLAAVVASQIGGVGRQLGSLLLAVPVYLLFAAAMTAIGAGVARWTRLDAPAARATVFSGVTRNSLVVLPLVLALPSAFDLAPLAVVTQTLVELLIMVLFVRLVPRLIRDR